MRDFVTAAVTPRLVPGTEKKRVLSMTVLISRLGREKGEMSWTLGPAGPG